MDRGMQYGDMVRVGEKSFDAVLIVDGGILLAKAAPKVGRYAKNFGQDAFTALKATPLRGIPLLKIPSRVSRGVADR